MHILKMPSQTNRTSVQKSNCGGVFRTKDPSGTHLVILGLLIANYVSYLMHILYGLWASAITLVLLITCSMRLNRRCLLARHFSWANIFIALLVLFHLGYYLPAKIGLIDEVDFMPSIRSAESQVAMILFCAAVLAFESGVLSGCRRALVRQRRRRETRTDDMRSASALLAIGLPVLALSIVVLAIFTFQQGGLQSTFKMSYADLNDFLSRSDSRFVETGVQFFPVGVLITYVGLLYKGVRGRPIICVRALSCLFIAWLLIVGSRGTAFLLVLALLYVGHLCHRPVRWRTILIVGILVTIMIPVIAAYRNVSGGGRLEAAREATLIPLAAALEMGQTYRTLVGFVDYFWKDRHPLMLGRSYWIAVPRLIPNVGLSSGSIPAGDYYRTTVWITELLEPSTARAGGGLGSTGIGEPYANFGYPGVVALFWCLGFVIGGLEQYFLLTRSGAAMGIICGIFIATNWYIRDDVYGTIRPVVWSVVVILFIFHRLRVRRNVLELPVSLRSSNVR